jgi:hypothetical protein
VIDYRLYCLKDGQIIGTASLEAEDDVAAVEAARARRASVDCELWSGSRLVGFIPARSRDEEADSALDP